MTRLDAAIALGDLDLADQLVRLLEELAADLGLERLTGVAHELGARLALRQGLVDLAAQRVEQARVAFGRLGAMLDQAGLDAVDAELLLERGDPAGAAEAAARSVAVFGGQGWLLYAIPARLTGARAGLLAADAPSPAALEQLADDAEALDAHRHGALARAYAVQARLLAGEPVGVPEPREDDPELVAVSAENLGLAAARDGNTAVTKGHFATAVSAWSQLGESVWLRRARGWLGDS